MNEIFRTLGYARYRCGAAGRCHDRLLLVICWGRDY